MAGEVVGSVYVRVRAITDQLSNDIQDGFDKGVREISVGDSGNEVGTEFGSDVADGFEETLDAAIPDRVDGIFKGLSRRVSRRVRRSGRDSGDSWSKGFSGRITERLTSVNAAIGSALDKFTAKFNKFADKFKIPLKPFLYALAVPLIAEVLQFLTIYIAGLVAQIGFLATALAGFSVAALGFLGGTLLGIIPLIMGFKTLSADQLILIDRARKVGKSFEGVGLAVQRELFPAIHRLFDALPGFIPIMEDFGSNIGHAAAQFTDMITGAFLSEEGLRKLQIVMNIASYSFHSATRAVAFLLEWILNLWAAAGPIIRDLSRRFVAMTKRWAEVTRLGEKGGGLGRTLETWYIRAVFFGQSLADFFHALWDTFEIGADVAQPFFDTFRNFSSRWREFTESPEGQNRIREVFETARPVVQEFNGLVADLVRWLWEESIDPENAEGMVGFFQTLRNDFLPWLQDEFLPAFEPLREPLGDFGKQLLDLVETMQEYETLENTIIVLSLFLDVLTQILEIPGIGQFLSYLLTFSVIMGTFGRLAKVLRPLGIVLFGKGAGLGGLFGLLIRFGSWLAGSKLVLIIRQFVATMALMVSLVGLAKVAAIIAIIVAAVAAAYLIFRNWDTITEWVDKVWDALWEFGKNVPGYLSDAWEWIKEFIGNIPEWLGGAWRWLVDGFFELVGKIPGLLSALWNWLGDVWDTVYKAVSEWIGDIVDAVWEWIKDFVRKLPGRLVAFADAVYEWIKDFIKKIPGWIAGAADALWQWIKDALPIAGEWLGRLIGTILGILVGLALQVPALLAAAGAWLWKWISDNLPTAIRWITRWGSQIAAVIRRFFTETLPRWINTAREALSGWIRDQVPKAVAKIREWANGIRTVVTNFFTVTLPYWIGRAKDMLIQWITEKIPEAKERAFQFFEGIKEWLINFVTVTLPEFVSNAKDKVLEWIGKAKEEVPRLLGELRDKIYEKLEEWKDQIPEKLADLKDTIWDWVIEAKDKAGEKLGEIYDAIVEWLEGIPGELLELAIETGAAIAEGIADGFKGALEKIPGGGLILDGLDAVGVDVGDLITLDNPFHATQDRIAPAFNSAPVPEFASGAFVKARQGGLLARLGEGGFDEVVLTTDPRYRDSNLELLRRAGLGSSGDTFDITVVEASNGRRTASDIIRLAKMQRYLGKV